MELLDPVATLELRVNEVKLVLLVHVVKRVMLDYKAILVLRVNAVQMVLQAFLEVRETLVIKGLKGLRGLRGLEVKRV
ncbi:MAG: hypothetical protein EBZ77_09985 [Chitinophagia bacterium]|nr:hypothetical protein [Chitinophagia bacterium]